MTKQPRTLQGKRREIGQDPVRRHILAMLLALIFLVSPVCVPALQQIPPDKQPLPPGFKIGIEAQPPKATVGDHIQIDLNLTVPAGFQVEIPNPGTQAGDFSIIEFLPGPALPNQPPGPEVHHRARITAAAFITGRLTFPPIPIWLKNSDGKVISTSSPSVFIEIQSVLTEKDPRLKDLKKQAEIPEPGRWLFWLLGALLCCLVGALAWWYWRRRHKPSAIVQSRHERDPLDLAEEYLRGLAAGKLPEAGQIKSFYVQISDIVKGVLETAYGTHAAEQTTLEIMEGLHGKLRAQSEPSERIEAFLIHCDLVKFAKYVPAPDEISGATESAFEILAEARKHRGATSIS
jgi:hypothetical protein